ncbi:MAG TPA: IS4 family transposase, partial [Burkholderiales bacterium]|nr:IS4 family transposase [Burkholderiales bacterium]
SFIHISDGKLHDVNVLDQLLPEPGAFYVMDRGYLDFERLHRLHLAGAFFVTRAKSNLKAQRRYSHPVARSTGLICDQTITLTVFYSKAGYPEALRRIRFRTEEGKTLVFLTNNFALPALTIAELYRFKQHLRIKSFFGTSENAVKTQVWIAVSVYVLVAIVRKRLGLHASLYETLQILSLTMFETTPLHQLLRLNPQCPISLDSSSQLNLFES